MLGSFNSAWIQMLNVRRVPVPTGRALIYKDADLRQFEYSIQRVVGCTSQHSEKNWMMEGTQTLEPHVIMRLRYPDPVEDREKAKEVWDARH